MGSIRLACMFCDRDDYDGVDEVPADWFSVDEVQGINKLAYEAGCVNTATTWYTHLGVCPFCQQSELGLESTNRAPL